MIKLKTVCAIIINDKGEILLTKRARDPYKDYWAIPSGIGESKKRISPEIAVIEEVRCDLGTTSFVGKYLFSSPIIGDEIIDEAVIFVGKIDENDLRPNPIYSSGYKWVSEQDTSIFEGLAFEHTKIIKEYFNRIKSS